MALIFEVIRGGGDNLAYIVGCSTKRVAAVVDPVSAHDILEFCDQKKLRILYVLNTHGHPDHTSGNEVIVNASGADVLGHPEDRIPGVTIPLKDGQVLEVGKVSIEVLHTPGHTGGSVCFKFGNRLVTGDTVFLGGAGNTRFGGNVKDLYATLNEKILPLYDRCTIHPGHDYAENNLRFARTLEPDNVFIDHKLKQVKSANRNGYVISSTMKEERGYNPFFRVGQPELIESLRSEYPDQPVDDPLQAFRLIRELRNNW